MKKAQTITQIERECSEMNHSDFVREFDSYAHEVQEALNQYASGDGYDHV